MALDALLFDVDGTLIDSNAAHATAWQRGLRSQGFEVPLDRIVVEIGKGGDRLVEAILGPTAERDHGDAIRARSREEFLGIAARERFAVFPGARELLEVVRARGMKVAIATSAKGEEFDAICRSAGLPLRELSDAVVDAEQVAATKPAPDLVTAATRALGVTPLQCAMVGDTPYDADACRHAGVVFLAVRCGGGGHDDASLRAAGARETFATPLELLQRLPEALARSAPGSARLDRALIERLMQAAIEAGRAAVERGETPAGCVLARGDGTIFARGHNRAAALRDKSAHGEVVAYRDAIGSLPLDARDVVMVTTLEPCVMCTGLAMVTSVDAVVYGLEAPTDGGTARVTPPTSPEAVMPRVLGGVLRDECRALFEAWHARYRHSDGETVQARYIAQLLAATERRG